MVAGTSSQLTTTKRSGVGVNMIALIKLAVVFGAALAIMLMFGPLYGLATGVILSALAVNSN